MVPHLAGRALTLRRWPNGVDAQGLLREAVPEPPPAVAADGARARRPQRHHRVLRVRRAGGAGVGGQHGRAGAARADGAGRRPRVAAAPSCSTSIPGPPAALRECAAIALEIRDVLGTPGPGGVPEDIGLQGPPALRAGQRAAHPRRRRRVRPGRGPGGGAAPPQGRRHRHDQGRAHAQGLHRLEPEQPAQDDGRRLLAAGPAPADGRRRRSRGTRSRRWPPAAPSCGSRPTTCWRGSTADGDLFAPVLTLVQELPSSPR